MTGVLIAADEDSGVIVGEAPGLEVEDEFVGADGGAIEEEGAGAVHGDVEEIATEVGGGCGGGGGGEVHLDALEIDHAEADEHEGGEEEEHDVDQGDDLDARLVGGGEFGAKLDRHDGSGGGVGWNGCAGAAGFGERASGTGAGEVLEVMTVVTGGFDEEFHVIDGAFEAAAEAGEAVGEVVEGEETENGDAESAGGGDEGFGDAATDLDGGQFLAADEAEGVHDADDGAEEAEEWGEGDEGAEDPEASFGVIEFIGGAELHGAEEGGVGVRQAVMDGGEERIARVITLAKGVLEPAIGDGGKGLIEGFRAAATTEGPPPEGPFESDH